MLVLLITLFFSLSVFSQHIPGAFGIDFGTHIKDIDVVDESKTSGGTVVYIVLPPHRVPFVKTYAVETTPRSKKVYAIWGRGEVSSKEECVQLVEDVAKRMEKEFGVKKKKPPFKAIGYYFVAGNRFAIVKCLNDNGAWNIYLQFYDGELEELAKREQQELNKDR
ncbi:hypothetical protein [Hydrogenivirga sp. 128-5-R1-1]|uniref:hypothetical protein n=1 Tax=Hydrogenivirga sp. 128-5-R1-1 TaxID=392423 RepID=UPI00015F18C2|nr:hypothetical protein [Hydrogenivirga sp. 128-5-R1-1]EDP75448.1 hypothetical protein HG1285_15826 [Hydrogenivirga sp. 128-5-R1-1]